MTSVLRCLFTRNSKGKLLYPFSVLIDISHHTQPAWCLDKTNPIKNRKHLRLYYCVSYQQHELCHTWVCGWSGLLTGRLCVCVCIFTEARGSAIQVEKVNSSTQPSCNSHCQGVADYSHRPSHCKCNRKDTLGVNGNQQRTHIAHTLSSAELNLWLSEHLSDHCEIGKSLSLPLSRCWCLYLAPFQSSPSPSWTSPQSVTRHEVRLTGRGYK